MRTNLFLSPALIAVALWLSAAGGRASGPKFYPDDPVSRDPENQDASKIVELKTSQQYDFVENSFLGAGDESDVPATNVNTIDEVPDSSWFTNRIGRRPMSVDEIVKGPDTSTGPAGPKWTITSAKSEGITPGLTVRDGAGQLYFIKFDPPSNPEMASGAELISTKLFYAFGYHVPENYIAHIRPDDLVIGKSADIADRDGREHAMTAGDLERLLKRAARTADGSYRVLASKALPGKPVGKFRYHSTRPDDPNDIYPHEHRRELRGLRLFAAWLNHDDSRSINTFDTLITEGNRGHVRHHLLDFGSTLGSGSTQAQTTRAGNEYIWEERPTFITMLTLGFYVRPWIKVEYPEYPSVGRIEAAFFQPADWKPEYPNAAFDNSRPEDLFWAARIAAAVPVEAIARLVDAARYADPNARQYLADVITARREKVLQAWLNVTNPVVNPALNDAGVLTFANAAEDAGAATKGERYTVQWSSFDNESPTLTPVGEEQSVTERRAQAPGSLLSSGAAFVAARVRAFHPSHPGWSQNLTIYFRRTNGGWTLVGLERNR
jgi:hypothetical protein